MNQRMKISQNEATGAAIVFARNLRDITRADLAAELGVSERTLGSIERGTRTAKPMELIAISHILSVPLEWLRNLDGVPPTVDLGPSFVWAVPPTHNRTVLPAA